MDEFLRTEDHPDHREHQEQKAKFREGQRQYAAYQKQKAKQGGGEEVTDAAKKELDGIGATQLRDIPREICRCLVKKGLTFAQAEALLEVAKDLLRNAEI